MDIQLQVNDKPIQAALELPANEKGPSVLVLHAWWGLNPYFKALCARLAGQGFVALAPDLNNGKVAHTVDEAKALMQERDFQFMGDTIMTAKDYLLAHEACSGPKIGVIGFSMGAAWSLIVASYAPDQVAASVLYYGSEKVDFSKIKSKVLGHFSDVDEWEPLDNTQAIENEMKAAGLDVTFYIYPGMQHWFMEDNRPEYNPSAAKLAWERTIAFLKDNL